ncbi:MAG TPA: DUF58 domain-containing protein [Bacillota bacterium]|nr:DUF58 domain-containing protein [Bacillota bacterium]
MTLIRRILFALTSLFMLFAGLYSGEYIFFIGFGLLLTIVLYSAITNIWVLLDFHYLHTVTPAIVKKGERARLTLQVHNNKPFIYPFIRLYYQTPISYLKGETEEDSLSILPFQHGEISHEFECSIRGKYPLGITRVEVGDMFGLFKFKMDLTKKAYHKLPILNVYPRIINLNYLPIPQISQEGLLKDRLKKTEEAATISDVQQHQYGDPMKKIHWKISSKLQDLYVINYETTTQPHTMIFMDTKSSDIGGLQGYELEDQLVETTTALVNYVLGKWLPLKLIVYEKDRLELEGRDPQDFQSFYGYLAGVSFDSPFLMTDIMQIESPSFHSNGSLILVVKKLDYDLLNNLLILRQTGVYPILFLIQHRAYPDSKQSRLSEELNQKGIPSFLIYHDQRLNEAIDIAI